MTPSRPLQKAWGAALLAAAVLLLAACNSEPATGPVPITYGRDGCDLCGMIISDPRFATEIRGGPGHKAYKFDDMGDALHCLERETWKADADVEIWVMDSDAGKTWLDARKAFFIDGMQSPMAHGFGAVADQRPGAVPFDEMKSKLLSRRASNFCATKT